MAHKQSIKTGLRCEDTPLRQSSAHLRQYGVTIGFKNLHDDPVVIIQLPNPHISTTGHRLKVACLLMTRPPTNRCRS
jgi:hypothetical protein